jgi:hypothetical protein
VSIRRARFTQQMTKFLWTAVTAAVLFATGCSLSGTVPAGNGFAGDAVSGGLQGVAHGGRQPVAGANVYAFAAGKTGYGSAPKLLAATTTSTDGKGYFSFTGNITCPGYSDPNYSNILYLVISGGQPSLGITNNSAALLSVLGDCTAVVTAAGGSAPPNYIINEVTTVASVTAMQQFFSVGTGSIGAGTLDTIGAPASNVQGLTVAANTVANMVSLTTATAGATTQSGTGANMSGVITVTITPETAKINAMANVLAACVNSAAGVGTPCAVIFPAVNATAATDTIQAAYYMASNPTDTVNGISNLAAVFGLGVPNSPFSNALTAAPTDWTIGITYSAGTGACIAGDRFLLYGYGIAVDAQGNVWTDNGPTAGALSEISGTGVPLACSGPVGPSRGGAVIDTNGIVWAASGTTGMLGSPSYVVKFDGANSTQIPIPGTTAKAYAMAADGNRNVFVTDASANQLYEFPSNATATTVPVTVGALASGTPYGLAVDAHGTVVVGQSSSTSGSTLTAFPLTTVGGVTYGAAVPLTESAAYSGVYGMAFDANGAFWIGNSAGSAASAGTGPGNTTSATAISYSTVTPGAAVTANFAAPVNVTGIFVGGMTTPRDVAIDGNDNIWMPNSAVASSGLYAVTELANNGTAAVATAISPTSTTAGSGNTVTNNGGFQKAATVLASPRAVAIDGSGNVWVTNTLSSTQSTWITEIVGAASPVVTPLSIALKSNKLGHKP